MGRAGHDAEYTSTNQMNLIHIPQNHAKAARIGQELAFCPQKDLNDVQKTSNLLESSTSLWLTPLKICQQAAHGED